MEWKPIETAPKGGGTSMVSDHDWVEPPKILLLFKDTATVGYWDWYYAESGHGYREGISAWISQDSGETLSLLYDDPTHWMPLPEPPK